MIQFLPVRFFIYRHRSHNKFSISKFKDQLHHLHRKKKKETLKLLNFELYIDTLKQRYNFYHLQRPHNRLSISKDECISIPGSAMKSSRERVKRKDGTRKAGKGRLVVDKDFQGEDEPGMGIKQGGH